MTGPKPYTPTPDGYQWVAVQEGNDWRPVAGKRCRLVSGHPLRGCGRPSVVEFARGKTGMWWAYCEDHTFGRWIEDGKVMQWVLRPLEDGAS